MSPDGFLQARRVSQHSHGFFFFSSNFSVLCCKVEGRGGGLCYTSGANLCHNRMQRKHLHFLACMCVIALCELECSSSGREPPQRFLDIAGGPCQDEGTGSEFTLIPTGKTMLLRR